MSATIFFAKNKNADKTIVIASALGVPRYIYFKLATFLANSGYNVLTFDYRGIYESQSQNISGSDIQMDDWGSFDIDAALQWSLGHWHPDELIYLGHSCGGQLLGLANHAPKIDKAIFVASQSGFWKLWAFPQNIGVWCVWQIIPLIANWGNDFPARALGLSSTNIPAGVAKQWARWGKSENYLWDFIAKKDRQRYRKLSFPLFALGFSDDRYFGPPKAVKKLLEYYPATQQLLHICTPEDYGQKHIGHFNFLKQEFKNTLWQELIQWIENDHFSY
ncbi:alpha/beta fold hydrolase [Fodinibius sp. Rm-B-1B1-1]|uniref:alpha/beta hydrolase family protein n=1 Tax=Fodinibius alkaliphilus TaxID=3140241 RepID=UPI00315B1EBF